ncbi:MAG: hypothetical protein ACK48Y_10170 [Planctomyces sp.]
MSLGLPLASLFRLRSARLIIGAGGAWISMEAYCETTDEQVINVVAIQQFQELAEVWRQTHHHSSFSAEPPCAGDESPGIAGATRASVQSHQNYHHTSAPSGPF